MQLTKLRKNSIFTFVIRLGGVAQLVERLNGIQEVRGSTPLISTTAEKTNPILSGSFSFRGLCTAMPCRLRREPLRAGAAFMRVNSLTSLLRKRCLLRTPSSPPQIKKTNPITVGFFFCFISGTGCDCRKGKGMLNKTQDVCALSHTFFYDFAVYRKQMPTIIRRSVDEIQHIDKARRGLVVYNCKIIQMVDNLCTMCVLYSRCKFIY